jgi:hypothetical protein
MTIEQKVQESSWKIDFDYLQVTLETLVTGLTLGSNGSSLFFVFQRFEVSDKGVHGDVMQQKNCLLVPELWECLFYAKKLLIIFNDTLDSPKKRENSHGKPEPRCLCDYPHLL